MTSTPVPRWRPSADDVAFWAVYGPWESLTPREAAGLMAGFGRPWWVVGGWAVEAFTGVERVHEDVDVAMFADDIPALVPFFRGRFHLWSNDGGTFRVLDDEHPQPLDRLAQVWVRRDATAPWVLDIIPNPTAPDHADSDGLRWVSRHDAGFVADLDEVTWVAPDGVRYLRVEVALLAKSRQRRPKDEVDLASAGPLLGPQRRDWLRDRLTAADARHPWLSLLDDLSG